MPGRKSRGKREVWGNGLKPKCESVVERLWKQLEDKHFVYVARKLPEEELESLREIAEIEMWDKEEEPVPRSVLLEKAERADALLTMLSDRVDEELLERAQNLKTVSNMAVGYDNIDVEAATGHNVIIGHTPDILTDTTADLAFTLLLASARRIVEASEIVKEGRWAHWSPFFMAGSDVHHKTIGIVGMGRIGEAVAKRAKGFDMEILYHNRSRKPEAEEQLNAVYCDFEELLKRSDFVVCLTPLTEETRHLFNKAAFQAMKPEALFINVARGAVVDEKALYEALKEGEIAGAGLDVFEKEPIPADHPLLSLKQVTALPHIGSASTETRHLMARTAVENIFHVLSDRPEEAKVVNSDVLS